MKEPKAYVDSYQLSIHLFHRTKNFPKQLRPTLGRKIEEAALNLTQYLRKTFVIPNKDENRIQKIEFLKMASLNLDELKVLIQLSYDLQAINVASLSETTILTREIGKEIGGLMKYYKGKIEK
jgi:four helix bundle protein